MTVILLLLSRRHAAPVEITGHQVHLFVEHHCTNRKDKLLSSATFLGVNVTDVQRHNCECFFWPLGGCRRKRHMIARPVKKPACVSFNHLFWQYAPDIVKVDGFDLDIREESVLVEEHRASSVVGHMEPVREELVVYATCLRFCFSIAPSLPRRGPGFQL